MLISGRKVSVIAVLGFLLLMLGPTGLSAVAAPPDGRKPDAPPARVTPTITPDPKIMELIDGLGDGSSATLPPIRTIGDWNETTKLYGMEKTGPVGRDYCVKMVWAPERKRALYCGANHGAPHRLNDLWEYDLPSNTWALLFAPDPTRPARLTGDAAFTDWVKKVAVVKDDVLMTQRSAPLDPWHTWWQVTYVPEMKALIWANPPGSDAEVAKVLGLDTAKLYKGPPFWLFYPEEKVWKPLKTEPPYPPKVGGAQAMEYLPGLGPVFYSSNWFSQGLWRYDPKSNAWKNLKPNGGEDMYHGKNSPQSEAVMAYDSENKVLVAQIGRNPGTSYRTYHYDVATNAWSKILEVPSDSGKAPLGSDSTSVFGYDPVAKVCLLYTGATPDSVWAYSVKTRQWTRTRVNGPAGPRRRNIGYFDPERNVLVVNDRDTVWVYRHKKAAR